MIKLIDILKEIYDDKGEGGKYTLAKQNPFDIKKLVDKGIIFVTKPGDGKGGVEEPNWEGDASIITLYNMTKADPWMKIAIKSPMPQSILYIQKDQDKIIYNGKYRQILWGIEKKGLKPEDFYLNKLKEEQGGVNTSWTSSDNEIITLQDILELTKDIKTQNFPTKELASIVLNWNNNPEEIEKISQVEVSSQYPILIMVDEQEKIQWILDGNHRAQKALSAKAKTIPAKLIKPSNLNSKAKKILLGIIDERLNKIKETSDPQSGKSAPYGSGYAPFKKIKK